MLTGVLNIEKTSIHFLWQYLDTMVRIIWTLPFSVLTEDWRLLWQLTNQQTSRKNRKSIVPAKKKNLLSPRALHQTMGTSLKQNKYKHTAYKNKETSNSHLPLDTGKYWNQEYRACPKVWQMRDLKGQEYSLCPKVRSILRGRVLERADTSQYRLREKKSLYNMATAQHWHSTTPIVISWKIGMNTL